MNLLLILPILIPLSAAGLGLFAWRWPRAQRTISVIGAVGLLGATLALMASILQSGPVAVQISGWAAPYGITIACDLFSAIMVVLNGIIGTAAVIYSLGSLDARRQEFGFHPLVHALLAACSGAFMTGDIFNLYVWFEVMLMSSFVLLTLGSGRAQLEGAIKYVALNLLSSAIFLAGVGLLYGLVGTLNMAHIGVRIAEMEDPGLITVVAMFFLVAFGIKAAVFPFFFWLPASYHTPPPIVSALFAGLLTKVGVYALIRAFMLIFVHDMVFTHTLILWIAVLTMVTGVLGAAAQFDFRRILSFHIVSQIGYMLMGLGLCGLTLHRAGVAEAAGDLVMAESLRATSALALTGAIFYLMHHIIVKTNLFLVSGIVDRLYGTGDLGRVGGLWRDRPVLSMLFLIPAMSLAGIPILSGFWAKYMLIRAGLEAQEYVVVGVALVVSVLTLFSMTKIWGEAFWNAPPEDAVISKATCRTDRGLLVMTLTVVVLALLTLVIGFGAQPFYDIALEAAHQLLDPAVYREAVLKGANP